MKWGLGLRDLDLSRGEALLLGVFLNPSPEEGFAASVITPDCLEG